MANAYITIDQFENLLKRVEKLEYREIPGFDELKDEYHKIEKEVAVTDTKIDAIKIELKQEINALRVEMNEKFNTMNEKFNSLEKRFTMMWGLQVATFLAILVLILKDLVLK